MRPYLIVTPAYTHQSNGIRLLHFLCHRLNELNVPAYLVLSGPAATNPAWKTPLATSDMLQDAIVIYPEIIPDNPLKSSRVVRWLLNRPGKLTGQPYQYMPDDYQVAFTAAVDPTKPVFQIHLPLHELFNPLFLPPKTEELFYVGKDPFVARNPAMELFKTEVTRNWPNQLHELADLLRRSRVLFSYDTLTGLALEAAMCGTLVVLIPCAPYTRADLERSEFGMDGVAWGAEPAEIRRALATLPKAYPNFLRIFDAQEKHILDFVRTTQERWRATDGDRVQITDLAFVQTNAPSARLGISDPPH